MLDSLRSSPVVLPSPDNMGVTGGISLLSCLKAEIYVTLFPTYYRLTATMFDLPVTPMSESIHTNLIVLLGPENVGLTVGILLLRYTQAEI